MIKKRNLSESYRNRAICSYLEQNISKFAANLLIYPAVEPGVYYFNKLAPGFSSICFVILILTLSLNHCNI